MPKRDLQDSVIEKVNGMAHSLKVVREDIRKISNYEKTLTTNILDHCELYKIKNEETKSFNVETTTKKKLIPLKDILDVFPNADVRDVLENVVATIDIDIEKTEENLRYSGDFQEPIIKNIIKQLDKVSKEEIKKVVLK